MSKRILTYKDQEWPTKAYRKKSATGCMPQTREGILHALSVRGAMSVRDLARIAAKPPMRDGLTSWERISGILKILYEDGVIGMVKPPAIRGRPSYKFVIL